MTKEFKAQTVTETFVDRSRRAIMYGLVASLILFVGVGGWATQMQLSGAVVSPGSVVVASDLKAVQHADGGIVGSIRVKNGDHVQAGDIVLSLDDKLLKTNRDLVDDQLIALEARLARLTAERDGLDQLKLLDELSARKDEPKVTKVLGAQNAVMETRRLARAGEVAAYREQIAQLEHEIEGIEVQRVSAEEQLSLIEHELSGLQTLFDKGYASETRITALKREQSGLTGSIGSFTSQIAVARGKISGIELAIVQQDKSLREQVANEISSLEPELSQLWERRSASDLKLARVDVRAPESGIVHELAVHTVDGIVQPGQTLMKIVPEADSLVITAAVAPQEINNVAVGQNATLVFAGFDRNVPRLEGTVTYVSADLRTDPVSHVSAYEVRLALGDDAAKILSDQALSIMPGMSAEVYISTGDRTAAQYLLEPLNKQLRNTFRET